MQCTLCGGMAGSGRAADAVGASVRSKVLQKFGQMAPCLRGGAGEWRRSWTRCVWSLRSSALRRLIVLSTLCVPLIAHVSQMRTDKPREPISLCIL